MERTSKYQMAEQAQRVIVGGHPTGDAEVSIQELMLFVSQAFGNVARLRFFEGKAEGESFVNGSFIFPFEDVEVKKNTGRNIYYSEMPASTITLPHEIGVYEVSLMKDQENTFVRVPNNFKSLYKGMAAQNLEGRKAYYLEGGNLIFPTMKDADGVEKVFIKLVAPIGDLGDEDPIMVPYDVQGEIVAQTIQLYSMEDEAEKDTGNDNLK